jgi:hypothetical protein
MDHDTENLSSHVEAISAERSAGLDFLRAWRAVLAVPARWTRHALARRAGGSSCAPTDPEAASWCLLGARAYISTSTAAKAAGYTAMLEVVFSLPPGFNRVADWNDAPNRTHAEVLDLLDRASARFK